MSHPSCCAPLSPLSQSMYSTRAFIESPERRPRSKKVDIGIDCTRIASLEAPELDFSSDSNGTHASSEGPRRVSPPSRCAPLSPLSQSMYSTRAFVESRERRPRCKKVDFGIDCTRIASLEAPELDFPSDSNGTHASSEGPRRVSLPSRCASLFPPLSLIHVFDESFCRESRESSTLQESRFRY